MAAFKLIPITLTLAGVAGFVLSMGLAVDANILIFERMKEELRLGRSLLGSIDTGWARAWPAIRDANISTLITVIILWLFADALNANLIKSFALALGVGTIFSMISAIFVTRTFLHLVVDLRIARRPWLFGIREMTGEDDDSPASAQPTPVQGGGD
jgi:preprotein translocase subunit SecD